MSVETLIKTTLCHSDIYTDFVISECFYSCLINNRFYVTIIIQGAFTFVLHEHEGVDDGLGLFVINVFMDGPHE